MTPFQFIKLDQKSEPPKFYEPNVLSSKLDTLEKETNASAVRVEKECPTTSARFEDKLSEPKLPRKESRPESIPELARWILLLKKNLLWILMRKILLASSILLWQ